MGKTNASLSQLTFFRSLVILCKQKWILSFLPSNTLTFALSFRQLLIISSIHHHHHFITRLPPSSIGSARPSAQLSRLCGGAGPSVVDEEAADEVKVFRSNNAEDDPTEMAGSSADLDADKQELAMEADIETQSNNGQAFNPLANPLSGPLPWPSPGSNFLFSQFLAAASLSPVYGPTIHKMATAMARQQLVNAAATAAFVAQHSPNYVNLGTSFGANPFERPPNFFSQPSTPSTTQGGGHHARNGQLGHQTSIGTQQMNSPMSALGGGFGGMSLATGEVSQQHKGTPSQMRTPKREKAERKERQQQHQREEKKDHIKKPMNAFMLFMKANRHKYLEESTDKRKQSAELNKELGQIWQQMSREAQQPYYEMAQKAKEEHARMHPQWSARENYAIHKRAKKKRIREKSVDNNEQKKCRARFGVDNQAKWCKHCRRKKRCLNVLRDSDSPVQVSSTTNSTTPLSIGLPSSAHFGGTHLGALFGSVHQQQLDSPSRKDRDAAGAPTTSSSTNNSERTTLSRCSSAQSSGAEFSSNGSNGQEEGNAMEDKDRTMMANGEGMETALVKKKEGTTSKGFKLEVDQNQQQLSANQTPLPHHLTSAGSSSLTNMAKPLSNLQHPSAFQMSPAFPFPSNFAQNPFISPFSRFF
uniref:HMG box domain-containing protein n=1 Tax=Globodera rostochiensis TaxID=31243 RepID=A0A914GQR3_GLORO